MTTSFVSTHNIPLKHIVLAVLSAVSARGRDRVPVTKFFEIFRRVVERYPDMFPGLAFDRTPFSTYSRQLDGALQGLVGLGVDIPGPDFRFIHVQPTAAGHFLARLYEMYGKASIDEFEKVADSFIEVLDLPVVVGPGSAGAVVSDGGGPTSP